MADSTEVTDEAVLGAFNRVSDPNEALSTR